MTKKIAWRANLLICLIIIAGFTIFSVLNYQATRDSFEEEAERSSLLVAESTARAIDLHLTQPIDVSRAMAQDPFLSEILADETLRLNDSTYTNEICNYLETYHNTFGFDSVFFISATSNRYYHFSGIDRIMTANTAANNWYWRFLSDEVDYELHVDSDVATDGSSTVFVNARIRNADGSTRGVIGCGLRMENLRGLISGYEQQEGVRVRLVDDAGVVRISSDESELGANLLTSPGFENISDQIMNEDEGMSGFWYNFNGEMVYLASRYESYLGWHLIASHDMSELIQNTQSQLVTSTLVVVCVIVLILVATTTVFRHFNHVIVQQTTEFEQRRKTAFQVATEQIYDNIYEVDLTHNHAATQATKRYFKELSGNGDIPFSRAAELVADKQIYPEQRQNYLDTFRVDDLLENYHRGIENFSCEYRIALDGVNYHWIRIYVHLFSWEDDGSIHMLTYRQNIEQEKLRERKLTEQIQRDPLTNLLNKVATEDSVRKLLVESPEVDYAFFILDIDDFKKVNDQLGHNAGDTVLRAFAEKMHSQFRSYDIVGRIGGDEFVAFAPLTCAEAERKASHVVEALRMQVDTDAGPCDISASIGVALFPGDGEDFKTLYRHADKALYKAKATGKSCYVLFQIASDEEPL